MVRFGVPRVFKSVASAPGFGGVARSPAESRGGLRQESWSVFHVLPALRAKRNQSTGAPKARTAHPIGRDRFGKAERRTWLISEIVSAAFTTSGICRDLPSL